MRSLGFLVPGTDVLAAEVRALDLDDLRMADDPQTGVDLAQRFRQRDLRRAAPRATYGLSGWSDRQTVGQP